ncbi:MAG: Xaa-Pro peptidase family protein [Pseudomonadota bacterium]
MIGGAGKKDQMASIVSCRQQTQAITVQEYRDRVERVCEKMRISGHDALYLDATTSLYYFTGLKCHPSERLHGAVIRSDGDIHYICPAFEREKTTDAMILEGGFLVWEEHENPVDELVAYLKSADGNCQCRLAVDPQTPFFTINRLQTACGWLDVCDGEELIASCRRIKSAHEIALMQVAKNATLSVHQAVAGILHEEIDTREVQAFLDEAHIAAGMDGRSTFRIVLFGEPTAYPHGVSYPQNLKDGDMVLIDTGATMHGYHSDITRSYVYGEPTARQREIWSIEQEAQAAAFDAAQIGAPCSAPDDAARRVIEAAGLGPDYQTPGLPHRTGHGIGLDVHEQPYIVRNNSLGLAPGMCFSIEPMICCYGEFGVRLEDHVYMTADGPKWFTHPSRSIDRPF